MPSPDPSPPDQPSPAGALPSRPRLVILVSAAASPGYSAEVQERDCRSWSVRGGAAPERDAAQASGLPPVGEPFTVNALLQRWPTAAEKAELVDGVLLFTGTFDERDIATARRAYPGRRVLLNADSGIEVHPAGLGQPRPLGA